MTTETPEQAWARACQFMRDSLADSYFEAGDDVVSREVRCFPLPPYLPLNPKVMSDA